MKHFINENYFNEMFSSKEKVAIISNKYGENCSLLTKDDKDKYFNNDNKSYLKVKNRVSSLYYKLRIEFSKGKKYDEYRLGEY